MVLVSIYLHASDDFLNFSIYANVQIALTTHRFKKFAIVTFTAAYERG